MIKRYWFKILSAIMCTLIVMGVVVTYWYMEDGESGKKVEASRVVTEGFTQEKPFTVYEIVPYMMYAEFGYHIEGGEITSYEKMETATENHYIGAQGGEELAGLMNSYGGVRATKIPIDNEDGNHSLWAFYSLDHFKRYSIIDFTIDDALLTKRAIRRRLERDINNEKKNAWHRENCRQTLKQYQYTKEEEELLKKYEAIHVVYKAVLISDVNADMKEQKKTHMLDNADLIFISGNNGEHSRNTRKKYLKDEYVPKIKPYDDTNYAKNMDSDPFSYDVNERLSWESADKIYQLASREGGSPVIMSRSAMGSTYTSESKEVPVNCVTRTDKGITQGIIVNNGALQHGISNNMYKLFLMLYQRDPVDFRKNFYPHIKDGKIMYQNKEAQTYWNPYAFYEVNWYDNINDGQNILAYNPILMTTGLLLNGGNEFFSDFIKDGGGITLSDDPKLTGQAECYLGGNAKYGKDLLDEMGKKSLSVAECLRYLVIKRQNMKAGLTKTTMKVLDIEPSNDFTLNEATIRAYLKGYQGEIQITSMTSAEFNSTKTDLAGTYDLIYMGDNIGGLSKSSSSQNSYRSRGDMVQVQIDGQVKNVYYPGNDITSEKRKELSRYIAAGRPIIMADSIYYKQRIDSNSNLAAFTSSDCKDAKQKGQVVEKTVCDSTPEAAFGKLCNYLNAYRPSITGLKANYTGNVMQAECKVTNVKEAGENNTLTATLYAVLNQSTSTEEVIGTSNVQANGQISINADLGNKPIGNVISYRLKVEVSGNEAQYAVETGVAKKTNVTPRTIRILQVIPPENATLDLTDQSTIVGQLLHEVPGENVEVKKMTTTEFELLYNNTKGGTPYQKAHPTTDALLRYDVVLFGASNEYPVIDNTYGALNNVIDYIKQHRAVIFTNGVLREQNVKLKEETKAAYDELRSLAGGKEKESFSYSWLIKNRIDKSGSTQYKCTKSDLTDLESYKADLITKVNDGQVSHYPYEIKTEELIQKTTSKGVEHKMERLEVAGAQAGSPFLAADRIHGFYALGNDDAGGRSLYSTSPNDTQNNYYLYQSGNVWYSGIGCNAVSENHKEEAKLFVNTILAAYEQAANHPTVSFVGTTKDGDGNDLAFLDPDMFTTQIKANKQLSFIPYDRTGKKLKTSIYVKTAQEIKKLDTVTQDGKEISLANTKLTSNTTYKLTIPADLLNEKDLSVVIYVENENGIGSAICKLIKRTDFDLD